MKFELSRNDIQTWAIQMRNIGKQLDAALTRERYMQLLSHPTSGHALFLIKAQEIDAKKAEKVAA